LGFACIKAARKMLVKLTLGLGSAKDDHPSPPLSDGLHLGLCHPHASTGSQVRKPFSNSRIVFSNGLIS